MNTRSLTLPVGPRPTALVAVSRPAGEGEVLPTGRADAREIDEETLAAARVGDRHAQEDFVRWYERRVHAFLGRSLLGRHQVDDLAQEVFLRVLRALPRFEPGPARVSTWIFSIAVRLLADHGRSQRRWFTWFDEERATSHGHSPEEGAIAREALTDLEVALARLSPQQRMALCLFEIHGLSHAEVAQAVGSSVATVKTRLFRARHALRKYLKNAPSERAGASR